MSGQYIEHQVSETSDGFELVVTISSDNCYWTSRPARLEAETWLQAVQEAGQQVAVLRRTLGLGNGA